MSTTKVQMPVKIDHREAKLGQNERQRKEAAYVKSTACNPTTNNNVPKRQQHGERKTGRKRAYSCAGGGPPNKRRCKPFQMCLPTLPTKFLLGGNIRDPLNLHSLQDEAVNREMNALTPQSSPLPTPQYRRGAIEVIIPPNLHDPLNLLTPIEDDAEYEQNLVSPVKRGSRKKNRKKKRNSLSGCSAKENAEMVTPPLPPSQPLVPPGEEAPVTESVQLAPAETTARPTEGGACRNLDLPLKKDPSKDKPRKCNVKDKIVSPVVPQPRLWTRPHGHWPNANKHHQKPPPSPQVPNFKAKNAKYQYGNYNRYYGYRNQNLDLDVRLKVFFEKRSLFQDKDVLDIGCNVGHITLSVARDLGARSVVGLDIDQHLIDIARKNVKHYVNFARSPTTGGPKFYPISMPIVYGPVDVPGAVESPRTERKKFPNNVTFVQGSYVLDSDALLAAEHAQFDVILCLSVTKWMHVNWGDAGIRQAFRRMFAQLRPGGKLILEAQGWDSYKKRKTLTETIYNNYREIRFFPQKFTEYLLSEVGFSTCEVLAMPCHPSKGFRRPIQMFTKGSFSSTYSAPSTPFHLAGIARGSKAPVYTPVVVSTRSVEEDEAFEPAGSRLSERDMVYEAGSSERVPEYEAGSSQRVPDYEAGSSQIVPEYEAESSERDVVYEDGVCKMDTSSFRLSEGVERVPEEDASRSERDPEDDTGTSEMVPEDASSSRLSEGVEEVTGDDRGNVDTFRGVVRVTDGNECDDEMKAFDFEESTSVSSLVTDASQTETQDSI